MLHAYEMRDLPMRFCHGQCSAQIGESILDIDHLAAECDRETKRGEVLSNFNPITQLIGS